MIFFIYKYTKSENNNTYNPILKYDLNSLIVLNDKCFITVDTVFLVFGLTS